MKIRADYIRVFGKVCALLVLGLIAGSISCSSGGNTPTFSGNPQYGSQYNQGTQRSRSNPYQQNPFTQGGLPITLVQMRFETSTVEQGETYRILSEVSNPENKNLFYKWGVTNGVFLDDNEDLETVLKKQTKEEIDKKLGKESSETAPGDQPAPSQSVPSPGTPGTENKPTNATEPSQGTQGSGTTGGGVESKTASKMTLLLPSAKQFYYAGPHPEAVSTSLPIITKDEQEKVPVSTTEEPTQQGEGQGSPPEVKDSEEPEGEPKNVEERMEELDSYLKELDTEKRIRERNELIERRRIEEQNKKDDVLKPVVELKPTIFKVTDRPTVLWRPTKPGEATVSLSIVNRKGKEYAAERTLKLTVSPPLPKVTMSPLVLGTYEKDQEVDCLVEVKNLTNFSKASFKVNFDNTSLKFKNAVLGDLVPRKEDVLLFAASPQKESDYASLSVGIPQDYDYPIGTDGVVLIATFSAQERIEDIQKVGISIDTNPDYTFILDDEGNNILPPPPDPEAEVIQTSRMEPPNYAAQQQPTQQQQQQTAPQQGTNQPGTPQGGTIPGQQYPYGYRPPTGGTGGTGGAQQDGTQDPSGNPQPIVPLDPNDPNRQNRLRAN